MTDSILDKLSNAKIDELLTKPDKLDTILKHSITELMANRCNELYRKIATYPVPRKVVSEVTNFFWTKYTNDEIDQLIQPRSDRLDDVLRSCLFARHFRLPNPSTTPKTKT